MRLFLRGLSLVATCLVMGGCNSIYLYESDKVSLTLESQADPSQPVSGNLGIKQRVVLVVPTSDVENDPTSAEAIAAKRARAELAKKRGVAEQAKSDLNAANAANFKAASDAKAKADSEAQEAYLDYSIKLSALGTPKGDAVSALSSFYFDMRPEMVLDENAKNADGTANKSGTKEATFSKVVTIDSAFITGDPAEWMTSDEAAKAMEALSGRRVVQPGHALAALNLLVSGLEEKAKAGDSAAVAVFNKLNHDYAVMDKTYLFDCFVFTDAVPAPGGGAGGGTAATVDLSPVIVKGQPVIAGTSKISTLVGYINYLNQCRKVNTKILACETQITALAAIPGISTPIHNNLNEKMVFFKDLQSVDEKIKRVEGDPEVLELLDTLGKYYFSK